MNNGLIVAAVIVGGVLLYVNYQKTEDEKAKMASAAGGMLAARMAAFVDQSQQRADNKNAWLLGYDAQAELMNARRDFFEARRYRNEVRR